MKFFGYLLFLILAALTASVLAYYDDDRDPVLEACKQSCNKFPKIPVCGTGRATYFNECAMKCEKAELIHNGPCDATDLLDNHGIDN